MERGGRHALAIGIIAAMLHLTTTVPLASTREQRKISGRTSIVGQVTIDDAPAISGQTIFSGTRIVTAHKSQSTIDLSSQSRLNLHAESTLFLEFSGSNISGTLTNGQLSGLVPLGVSTVIRTNNASIVTDSCEPAAFSIQVTPEGTKVTVNLGRVEVVSRDTRTSVKSGETLSSAANQLMLTAGPPQASDDNKVGWMIAGVAAAVAVVLVAIVGRSRDSSDFGGCVIVPSSNNDPSPVCP